MATTPVKLLTFEEFEQLPTPTCARLELRNGEVIPVPPPVLKHLKLQKRLLALLDAPALGKGFLMAEFGFRLPGAQYRIADVAFATQERLDRADDETQFQGAPDLVIEILSPSNTPIEMFEKSQICLENGCREFWLVDADLRQVRVSTPDGHGITYKSGQRIPLLFGGELAVEEIFV